MKQGLDEAITKERPANRLLRPTTSAEQAAWLEKEREQQAARRALESSQCEARSTFDYLQKLKECRHSIASALSEAEGNTASVQQAGLVPSFPPSSLCMCVAYGAIIDVVLRYDLWLIPNSGVMLALAPIHRL